MIVQNIVPHVPDECKLFGIGLGLNEGTRSGFVNDLNTNASLLSKEGTKQFLGSSDDSPLDVIDGYRSTYSILLIVHRSHSLNVSRAHQAVVCIEEQGSEGTMIPQFAMLWRISWIG